MIPTLRVKRLAWEVHFEASNYHYPSPSTLFAAIVAGTVGDAEAQETFSDLNLATVSLGYRELEMLAKWIRRLAALSVEEQEALLELLLD